MTADLTIHNIDESYVRLSYTNYGVFSELRDKFTFKAEGYLFSPKYKKGIWDGNIRLLHNNGQIYRGLVDNIINYCQKNGYSCEYEGHSYDPTVTMESLKAFIETLNLQIQPRYYQLEAVLHALKFKRAVILSPTASGKSLIIYIMMRYLLDIKGLKGLLVVPTIGLVNQMYSDFEDYSEDDRWETSDHAFRIYAETDKDFTKDLTISTWQSIYKHKQDFFSQFQYVLVDETHHAKAKSLIDIMINSVAAQYRIGLTGTLDGKTMNRLTITGLFGPIIQVATTKDLMDQKFLAKFKIKALVLRYTDVECDYAKNLKYYDEIDFLISHPKRNRFITKLALATTTNTLVLFNRIEHGETLYETIGRYNRDPDRKIFLIYGATEAEQREQTRHIVETEKNAIIVASVGVYSTGTNIRNLHNIIFAAPSKSRIRTLQSIGRGLRLNDNKEYAVLFDIADDLRHKKKINTTLMHFDERIKIYTSESFEFKVVKITL